MEKNSEINEKNLEQKDENEEKEIMFVMDKLEKCSLCGKDGAYIKEEGVYICNDCFVEQKREIFNLYMNKVNIYPSYAQITDKIYLGNEDTARDKELLKKLNISHILTCAEGCASFFPNDFKYKTLYIDDAIDEDILSWFKEAFEFIDSSVNNIYIHCVMGVSRSPSIVIAYLMFKKKMKYEEAFDFVKAKRDIWPNSGFREQLQKFGNILEENNYILPDNLAQNNNNNIDDKINEELNHKN